MDTDTMEAELAAEPGAAGTGPTGPGEAKASEEPDVTDDADNIDMDGGAPPHIYDLGDAWLTDRAVAAVEEIIAEARARGLRSVSAATVIGVVASTRIFAELFARDGVNDDDVDDVLAYMIEASDHARAGPRKIEQMISALGFALDRVAISAALDAQERADEMREMPDWAKKAEGAGPEPDGPEADWPEDDEPGV